MLHRSSCLFFPSPIHPCTSFVRNTQPVARAAHNALRAVLETRRSSSTSSTRLLTTTTTLASISRLRNFLSRSRSVKTHALSTMTIPKTMKAIHISDIGGLDKLVAAEVPVPELGPTDILVNVKAVSMNPVEAKIRAGKWAGGQLPAGSILGFDCSGVVASLGSSVPSNAFTVGEEVWLLGSTVPTHSDAEYVSVDYRVVSSKPKTLSFEDAAGVPLVGLTAWEMIDQTGVGKDKGALLVINGAGGVGSVAIQLAKAKGVKNIIATASREVSIAHVKALGATHVISHREPLKPQIEALKLDEPVKYILVFINLTKDTLDQAIDVVAPWGHIGLAVQGPPGTYDGFGAGQKKGVSVHWGFVFTRMALKWEMEYQGRALKEMARLFDEGKLKSITTKTLEMTVQGVRDAHILMESGETIGKVVLKVPEQGAFQ